MSQFQRFLLALLFPALWGCGNGDDGTELRATLLSAGGFHTCAASGDSAACWGENSDGQLGNGGRLDSPFPVRVEGLAGPVEISAGRTHACALLPDGTVRCWGRNAFGQLGNALEASSTTPIEVSGLTGVGSISAGNSHTCAVLSGGTVACWGNNEFGQLGNGSFAHSASPVAVTGLTGATAVSAGGTHTCALVSGGGARCWGSSLFDQLGNAGIPTGFGSTTAVEVTGLSNAVSLSAGENHTCALLDDSSIRCWGDNSSGQLGSFWPAPNLTSSSTLIVPGVSEAVSIAAGLSHSCAALSNKRVFCWGENADGQLGNGSFAGFVPPGDGASPTTTTNPVQTAGLTTATSVTAGFFHSCAGLDDGRVACWGRNTSGQLGDGTDFSSPVPVLVIE
ncbi:MAG: hypothetical protein K8I01_11825 [Candidatus Methylomirabilis sp.]|nr:hypothetical protein [Deltaproteobacteria bacterium]